MSVGRSTESLVGSELAGYRIEALIGRGGMGAVYRAQEAGLERKVALKVIAPELAEDEHFRDRFLRESQIAASLDHPHVVPIHKAGDEDGLLFLAMRYVEGTDLARLFAQEGALEPGRAFEILEQVAEALDAAHELGLVHRDVKPSNVLIAPAAGKEHCYLADFGLTKRTASLSGVSAQGQVVGTLAYVAPEQITGEPLDARSDVYSLGCVLYECLTGQAPFPRATDVALLWAHVHEEPTPPSEARPELPRELDTVLARALAKEPARRYRSAGELMAATRSALGIGETARTEKTPRLRAAPSRIQLCGRIVIELRGQRLEDILQGRQSRLLLAYLVANRLKAVSREELKDALWAREMPRTADSTLSAVLSRLRRALGSGVLRGRTEIQLALPTDIWIDLEAAREAIHQAECAVDSAAWTDAWGPARVALNIASRGFLTGEEAPWIDERRRFLGDVQVRALECVARVGLALGGRELASAERSGRALVELAPYRESGYRLLMEVLMVEGNEAEALQVYDRLRRLLHDELGTAPAAATQALHKQLLQPHS